MAGAGNQPAHSATAGQQTGQPLQAPGGGYAYDYQFTPQDNPGVTTGIPTAGSARPLTGGWASAPIDAYFQGPRYGANPQPQPWQPQPVRPQPTQPWRPPVIPTPTLSLIHI